MNPAVLYLLKVVLCSGVLYAYYLLALRNRIFHQWNRFYLLAAVLFSLIFPIVPLPDIFQMGSEQQLPFALFASSGNDLVLVSKTANQWSTEQIITILYAAITAGFLLKILFGWMQILRLLRRSQVQQMGSVSFVPTDHPTAPFSFFNWLFWKKDIQLHSPGGQSIFRHELVHIREKHSLDKLLMQMVLAVCWFNPLFWIIRRELQMIHEFIADKKAVGDAGTDTLAAMILQSAYGNQYNQLINPFFQKPIKRRLAMLQKTMNKPRNAYLGRVLSFPLGMLLLIACANKESGAELASQIATTPALRKTAVTDTIPTDEIKEIRVNKTDSVKRITILYKNGKGETMTEQQARDRGLLKQLSTAPVKTEQPGDALVIIDGVEDGPASSSKKMKDLNPNTIKNVDVLKGESATKLYGEKGRNGVIIITTKSDKADPPAASVGSDANIVFEQVEQAPSFPGGDIAWRAFLRQNLDAATPIKNGAPAGTYKTQVEFLVAADGTISNIKSISNLGYGMEEAVLKAMQQSPKWKPAQQNGQIVAAIHKQPVTFVVAEQ